MEKMKDTIRRGVASSSKTTSSVIRLFLAITSAVIVADACWHDAAAQTYGKQGGGGALTPIPDQTLMGNVSGSTATPTSTTTSQVKTMLGVQDSTNVAITGGTITGVNEATDSVQGAMSATDKTKLDGINAFAEYTFTATSATQQFVLSPLNGDADGFYRIRCEIISGAASNSFGWYINSSANNMRSVSGDGFNGAARRIDWQLAKAGTSPAIFASGDVLQIMGTISARSGRKRLIRLAYYLEAAAGNASDNAFTLQGEWTDTGSNITQMQVVSSVANGVGAGSYCVLTAQQSNF